MPAWLGGIGFILTMLVVDDARHRYNAWKWAQTRREEEEMFEKRCNVYKNEYYKRLRDQNYNHDDGS